MRYSFGFLHNHKVLQIHLVVEEGWCHWSIRDYCASAIRPKYCISEHWVDRKFRFYINRATDWCYIACNSCQRILRNSICLLRHTFAIRNHHERKTTRSHHVTASNLLWFDICNCILWSVKIIIFMGKLSQPTVHQRKLDVYLSACMTIMLCDCFISPVWWHSVTYSCTLW